MKSLKLVTLLTFSALALISSLVYSADQLDFGEQIKLDNTIYKKSKLIKFDVAESMSKFIFDEAPLLPSGLPAYGNSFITQGYIYPHGTLESGNGVLADGSPEFPELVIGEWTCRGYMIGNGAETTAGPWVITTQHYDFYEEPGFAQGKQSTRANLVTDGYELADVGVAHARAVTGGTGQFKRVRGEAQQTLLGFNASEGVNLSFEIRKR